VVCNEFVEGSAIPFYALCDKLKAFALCRFHPNKFMPLLFAISFENYMYFLDSLMMDKNQFLVVGLERSLRVCQQINLHSAILQSDGQKNSSTIYISLFLFLLLVIVRRQW
jgi:hypothetical protein